MYKHSQLHSSNRITAQKKSHSKFTFLFLNITCCVRNYKV